MAGEQVSSFPSQNILYDAASGATTANVQNALYQGQKAQQEIGANDIAMVGQAAAPLLGMSEADAASAYPEVIRGLQAQGFAKQAPSQYPGHAATQALVQRAMSLKDQISSGYLMPPGFAGLPPLPGQPGYGATGTGTSVAGTGSGTAGTPLTPAPGGNYGAGGPGGSAQPPAEYMPFYEEASKRTGIPVDVLIAQHRQESGFDPKATGRAGEIGIGQVMPSTAMAPGYGMAPLGTDADQVRTALRDPRTNINFSADYLKARMRPGANPGDPAEVRRALVAYNGGGDPNYVANVTRYLPASAGTAVAAAPGQPAQQANAAPPAAPGGVAARTGGTDVAGPGAGPAAPGAPATPLPPDEAVKQAQASGQYVPVAGVDGYWATPQGTLTSQPPPPAPPPAQRQPPPAQQQQPPPALPATGVNSPQFQEALRLNNLAAQYEAGAKLPGPRGAMYAAEAQRLRAQAQLYMQADSVVPGPGGVQIHTLTGKQDDPAKPLAEYHETTPGSGIWVGGPGTEPRFQPPGRLVVGPDGTVWQTSVGGARVLQPSDPAAIAARKAAEAQGTKTGTEVAESLPKMMDVAQAAQRAEGNIDYGLSQLDKAKEGGITTGYFSGALTTVQSALKSLGLPTDKIPFINVDPGAIGNIQTARKTLAVVSGSILQQIIGPGSPITDSKIEAFIHAQPGIETDPDAVRRVLAWARSQFTYDREMGQAAVRDAAETPSGTLPLNWRAKYYRDHGFAPIYNQGTGEMQQPDGSAPGRVSPPPPATANRPPLASFTR